MPSAPWPPLLKWKPWGLSKGHIFFFVGHNALHRLPMKRSIRRAILLWHSIISRLPLIKQEPTLKKQDAALLTISPSTKTIAKNCLRSAGHWRPTILTRSQLPGLFRFKRSKKPILRQLNSFSFAPFSHLTESQRSFSGTVQLIGLPCSNKLQLISPRFSYLLQNYSSSHW